MNFCDSVLSFDLVRDGQLMVFAHYNHTDDVYHKEQTVDIVEILEIIDSKKLELKGKETPKQHKTNLS